MLSVALLSLLLALEQDGRPWITSDDYPPSSIKAGEEGVVYVGVDAGKDGLPIRCTVRKSSGHPALDAATCKAIMRSARLEIVTDDVGEALAQYRSISFGWWLPGSKTRQTRGILPDVTLTVQRLPADTRSPIVKVRQLIDVTGKQVKCSVVTGSGSKALDASACPAVASDAASMRVLDRSSQPLPSMVDLDVAFRTEGAATPSN